MCVCVCVCECVFLGRLGCVCMSIVRECNVCVYEHSERVCVCVCVYVFLGRLGVSV